MWSEEIVFNINYHIEKKEEEYMDYEVKEKGSTVKVEVNNKPATETDRIKAYAEKLGVKLQKEEE